MLVDVTYGKGRTRSRFVLPGTFATTEIRFQRNAGCRIVKLARVQPGLNGVWVWVTHPFRLRDEMVTLGSISPAGFEVEEARITLAALWSQVRLKLAGEDGV